MREKSFIGHVPPAYRARKNIDPRTGSDGPLVIDDTKKEKRKSAKSVFLHSFSARQDPPYYAERPGEDPFSLSYLLCSRENAREMQLYAARNFLGMPEGIPDERMMADPVL